MTQQTLAAKPNNLSSVLNDQVLKIQWLCTCYFESVDKPSFRIVSFLTFSVLLPAVDTVSRDVGLLTFFYGIFSDPRERVKEDDLDVVLSPQRRSFGGGCHVTAAVSSRRSGSPLEKDSDGLRLLGGRRIGSGRIISARAFEKDHRLSEKDLRDLRDRDRERDYKDKRFRVCPLALLVLKCLKFDAHLFILYYSSFHDGTESKPGPHICDWWPSSELHPPSPASYLEKLGFTAHSYASQGEIRGGTIVVTSFSFPSQHLHCSF